MSSAGLGIVFFAWWLSVWVAYRWGYAAASMRAIAQKIREEAA